ncbi:CDP-diacylglycerol--glycerol-3-phosphate 3-phosphatidyltransferase [Leptospira ryugenii]|uniref:CDP-diacylglycerol--glycerol-3-phosphate 3-phosphatidyltransferase n=1 Tax=Leptospira ryugenii TaxID=1917863 RepID=A0A2P2DWE5_9LEPT|nr:CDP-alcohol phosphatidyltransferase family protein [Leptospira ryugenii]GBF48951.1 CDP-diacylglycerol--glycerol-3-phosphate 3-phosphatidyltransferase [Leptospira ryugenii]
MSLQGKKAKEIFEDRIFTLSNFFSISRVLMLPFFFISTKYYAENPKDLSHFYLSIFLCLAAVLSDFFDGFFARILKQETNLGRYLDPVCDKFVTLGGLFIAWYHFGFPFWILCIYLIRELLGVWLGGFLYLKRGLLGKPNWWGKFGVGFVALSVLWYMLIPHFKEIQVHPESFIMFPEYSAYLLLFVLCMGVIFYGIRYWNIVFHPEQAVIDPQDKKQAKMYKQL